LQLELLEGATGDRRFLHHGGATVASEGQVQIPVDGNREVNKLF
jgi:hypothetical protein